jgi:hypothetical protein
MADKFMNHERLRNKAIGPGDDTFIVGRFVGHDGKQKNRVSVRFGAISMMADPSEGVMNSHLGRTVESFLIETHTICGYSGSPVFLHIDPTVKRPETDTTPSTTWRGPWLLGVDTANITEASEVLQFNEKEKAWEHSGDYVRQSTGMIAVTPAWHITALLNDPALAEERAEVESEMKRKSKAPPPEVVLKSAGGVDAVFDETLRAMLSSPPSPHHAKPKPKRSPAKKG